MQIPQGDIDLLAIGEALVDFISIEEAASLTHAQTFTKKQGGSPANIAVNASKLGGMSAIAAKVGRDTFGDFIRDEISAAGVNIDYLSTTAANATSMVFVTRSKSTPDFCVLRGADTQLMAEDIPEELVSRAKIIHTSTWPLTAEPSRSTITSILKQAQDMHKIISCDPNFSPKLWSRQEGGAEQGAELVARMLQYASITKPSLDDARRIFGENLAPDKIIERFHTMGPQIVVLTMGKDGTLVSEGDRITHLPSRNIKVVDSTGAGDAFWAGFLMALLDGYPLTDCAQFAREIAEIKLSTIGPLPGHINRQQLYQKLFDT
jgi:fructokinase